MVLGLNFRRPKRRGVGIYESSSPVKCAYLPCGKEIPEGGLVTGYGDILLHPMCAIEFASLGGPADLIRGGIRGGGVVGGHMMTVRYKHE